MKRRSVFMGVSVPMVAYYCTCGMFCARWATAARANTAGHITVEMSICLMWAWLWA